MNLGLGAEFRYEHYSIYKGEEASYKGYPNTHDQAPGSQGFPGFSPADEIKAREEISACMLMQNKCYKELALLILQYGLKTILTSVLFSPAKFARYKVSNNFSQWLCQHRLQGTIAAAD